MLSRSVCRFAVAVLVATTCWAPASAKVVFLANGTGPTDFYWFDSGELVARQVKTFSSAQEVHALAFCPDRERGSNLIGLGKENGVIFEVDLGDLEEVVIGSLPAERIGGVVLLTCDRDGTLYLGDQSTEELYRLDPATCQPTCAPVLLGVVETAVGAGDVDVEGGDIHIDEAGELYLVTNIGVPNVFRVDKTNARATAVTTIAANGWITGTSWWADDRMTAMADDDRIYWADLDGGAGGALGSLRTPDGGILDITTGDLARPVSFENEVSVTVTPTNPRRGDVVTYDLFFRQMDLVRTSVRFQIWIEDAAGDPVTPILRSDRVDVRYLNERTFSDTFTIPQSVATGSYTMIFEVWNEDQEFVRATAQLEVVP